MQVRVFPKSMMRNAIQVPKADPSIAAKDQEEKMRAIAAWLDVQKAIGIEFDNVEICFMADWDGYVPPNPFKARGGDWIIADGEGSFTHVTNKTFHEEYMEVFER
jgi:hypothetical protein